MGRNRPSTETAATVDVSEWNSMVADVSMALGMSSPPAIEVDNRPSMGGGMGYDSTRDVLRIYGGWIAAEPNADSLASQALIAHELGHRLERAALQVARRRLLVFSLLAGAAIICGVAVGTVPAFLATDLRQGPPAMPWWFSLLPFAALLPVIVVALVKWPFEYRADDAAARLFGPQSVSAYLDVFEGAKGWTRPSPTHPSHNMRRSRQISRR